MAENKWVTGVITLLIGVINIFISGRGPPCRLVKDSRKQASMGKG